MNIRLLFIALLSVLGTCGRAQTIRGHVTNEFAEPVPYANILVQELGTGTTTDDAGYYELNLETEGNYRLIFSSLGYASKKVNVILIGETKTVDLELHTSGVELEEITVKASGKDPAYGIIREVVKRKAQHLRSAGSYRTKVYLKAVEEVDRKSKKTAPPPAEESVPPDPFAEEERKRLELVGRLNLLEMEVLLNFQQPRQYKEERTAYETYGDTRGLFVPRFGETDFNFYRNMVSLTGISDTPVISPLSNTGVLSYKFKLESTDLDGDQIVYRIRVIPRKKGNSTCAGTLWINEGSWTINRLDLTMPKYSLQLFDAFRLKQAYTRLGDSLWIVNEQVFDYVAREGKRTTFRGTTTLSYSDYEHNYRFPEKFFGNEVAVTTREAYERDSSYWQNSRTVALTNEEAQMIAVQDSIDAVVNSKAYQDSLQDRYNKVTLLELVWDGVGFRNNERKSHLYLGSIPELIGFSPVGGFRLGPYVSYNRRYADGKMVNTWGTVNVGLTNGDVQGSVNAWFRYNPFFQGDVSFGASREFESINQYDAYLNQLRPSNYILRNAYHFAHRIEVLNGLFLWNEVKYQQRKPITGLNTSSFLDDLVEDEEDVLEFEPYETFITTNSLSFTPGQKYMREPDRKIRLASKWPTFTLLHQKGWNGPLGSDVDFDYLGFHVEQNLILGTLGNSKYEFKAGKFFNTRDLRFIDYKRFRESDPLLLSDPLN
ncbi:MAG: DUF5686 and carboxypeptidase regulatory-like domain-containing protein, partial [Bacteroidota bacterium]